MRVKHVYKQKNRHGRIYWRHRITGERLDVDAQGNKRTEEQIAARANEINAGLDTPKQTKAFGSLASLIARYQASPDYRALRNSTKREYNRHMNAMEAEYGEVEVADVSREDVLNLRDSLYDTPRKADARIGMLRTLFNFAMDRPREFGLTANPASRIKKLHKPGEGWPAWPDHIIERTSRLAREQGEMPLLFAMTFALYTGQRCADLAAMQNTAIDGGFIQVFQEKSADTDPKTGDPIPRTGKEVWIPIHKALDGAIIEKRAFLPTTHNVLVSSSGVQWTAARLSQAVSEFMRRNGMGGYSLHGLRKSAVVKLMEIGLSKDLIKDITGQETTIMVEHYGQAADRKKVVQAAMKRWERDEE